MVVRIGPDSLSDNEVNTIFRTLADRTRRDIVCRTLRSEVPASHLADSYDVSFAAVQKHVAMVEVAGLVSKRRDGRERLVRSHSEQIRRVQALLGQYEQLWWQRINQLDQLASDNPKAVNLRK